MAEREAFLRRWARLKQRQGAADGTAAPDDLAPAAEPDAAGLPLPGSEPHEAGTAFDLADLPAIETLTAESDVRAFLRPGVPEAMRNAALRRIWSLDPAIRDFVGLADYAWDYNDPTSGAGLGPLGPDVDLEQLLAHALGRAPARANSPDETPSEEEAALLAKRAQDSAPIPPPKDDRDGLGESTALAAWNKPADEEPSLPRRHGGALPR